MSNIIYLTSLYDIYGELLSDMEKKCFMFYYFDNLSLSEIGENLDLSRNGVHKHIKNSELKLKELDSILKLNEKNIELKSIIESIDDEKLKDKLEKLSW